MANVKKNRPRCRRGIKNADNVYDFLNLNCGIIKEYVILELIKRFYLPKEQAEKTYAEWKKDFLKSKII